MGSAALAAALLHPCKVTRISCQRQRNTKTKLKKKALFLKSYFTKEFYSFSWKRREILFVQKVPFKAP